MALPTLRIIGFIIGIFLITLAISMAVPMLTLVIFDHMGDLPSFLWASLITFLAGLALVIPGRPEQVHLRPRDMYLLTVSSWVVVCIFAALPFLLTQHISYTDSFFESMSGITATGSTVLSGLDTMSPGILMWRSMLHWLGGIGFIGMAVAILPLLRIGGMRLFQTRIVRPFRKSHAALAHGGAPDCGHLCRYHHSGQPGLLVGRNERVRCDQPCHVGHFHRRFFNV